MLAHESGGPEREVYLFDSFEVSLRTRSLLQDGERLKIQELPFQMLLVLLETPGELVSKEQLGKRLWGHDTFVEVDKNLYVVAGKLREALGDDATRPNFIRTVSGRGYIFVGELGYVAGPAPPLTKETLYPPPRAVGGIFHWPRAANKAIAAALTLTLMVSGLLVGLYKFQRRPLAGNQDRVVFGGFVNGTGDPNLDQTLSSAAQLKLQESPYLSLIPEARLRAILRNPEAPLRDELHACESLGGQLLLRGGIDAKAKGYEIIVTVWSCASHQLLSKQSAEAASKASILPALDSAIEKMRRRLGEPESSLLRFNIPLEEATTPSLSALKAFTLGEQKRNVSDYEGATASYKLAIELDPQFAIAYDRLGVISNNASLYAQSRDYFRKAFELKNRASDREKLYILTHYYEFVTGEKKRAIDDYEIWRALYPRDFAPINNLAVEYLRLGQTQEALALAHTAVQLNPTDDMLAFNLGFAYRKVGDNARLSQFCKDPMQQKTTSMWFHRTCYLVSFSLDDEVGMQQEMSWAAGKPEESQALDDAAWVAMYRGQVGEAHRLFAKAVQSANLVGSIQFAADSRLDEANLDTDLGYLPIAKQEAQQLLSIPLDSALEQAQVATILARTGNIKGAELAARHAATMAPLDTIVNAGELAVARSAIYIQQHNPQAAVQALEETRPWSFCPEMQLAPSYYRGLAYLQEGKPSEAVVEFQRVIDHSALADFPVYVALSQLELGRAYMLLGEKTKAAPLFAGLERLWSHADPGFLPMHQLRIYEGAPKRHHLPNRPA